MKRGTEGENLKKKKIVNSSFEVLFYIGIATFLLVTDRVQRPYIFAI